MHITLIVQMLRKNLDFFIMQLLNIAVITMFNDRSL